MAGRHTREEVTAFAAGEAAQVLARDTASGELVFLERGQAAVMRVAARAGFECPIPGCAAPRPLTTSGGSRRDHFKHLSRSSHPGGVESLFHVMAKHRVAEWARAQAVQTGASVEVAEEVTVRDAFIHRRADVMVTWPATGQRVAFEVEYKNVAPDQWWAKHRDYLDRGIVPVWLFGHTSRYLRPETRVGRTALDGEPRFRLTILTEQVARAGGNVLFINPVEALVGTLFERGSSVAEYTRDPNWWVNYGAKWAEAPRVGGHLRPCPDVAKASAALALCPLDDCELDPVEGLITPTTRLIADTERRVREELDQLAEVARTEAAAQAARDAALAAISPVPPVRDVQGHAGRRRTGSGRTASNAEFLAQRCVCGHVRNVHGSFGCGWCACRRMQPGRQP